MGSAPPKLVAACALVVTASLAVGTGGAFVGPTDSVAGEVTAQPSPGPNGAYAYLRDGKLVVDLTAANPNVSGEGVTPDGVTTVDDVFRVRYGGDRFARIWITDGSEAVTLRARGSPIGSEDDAVVVESNETVAVGLRVDTTGSADGLLDQLTIHANLAEPGDVTGATDPTGDGDDGGSTLDDTESDTGADTGTELAAPELRVTDVALERSSIESGASVGVAVTVTNRGSATGERAITVTVGETQASESVSLPPSESTTVRYIVGPLTAGEHVVTVDGVDSGAVTVTESTDGGAVEPGRFDVPGLVPVGVLLALLTGSLLLARRRSREADEKS